MANLELPELATLDLDAYCERINYRGERAPTLAVLREIQGRHIDAIPFENLASLAGDPVPLDLASLEAKLVRSRRGGYCFEHNILFAAVLQRLGFTVTGLAARVIWKAPPGTIGPRTHMLLRIDLPGSSYIADTGFGGATLPGPIELAIGRSQQTPIEPYRLLSQGDGYQLEVEQRGEWQPVYTFDLQPQRFVDYQVANWYVSAHPASRFRQVLLVARATGRRRQSIFNDEFRLHDPDRGTERRQFASTAELREALANLFGIEAPRTAATDAALERIFRPA